METSGFYKIYGIKRLKDWKELYYRICPKEKFENKAPLPKFGGKTNEFFSF